VLIDVAYGGCNFADTMIAKGTYPHPKGYPIVAGLEVSGRVAGLGPGVHGPAIGDRVAVFLEQAGGFAERCVAPVERLAPIPDAMGLDIAAAFPIQGLTAWHLLHNVSVTKPGDVILLHAVGGGLGLFATQLAVRAGATVIGTVGTRGKEKRALEYGAALVVNREDEDFVAAAMAFTGDRGVDKIIDSTGAAILDRSFACIRKLGHVVSYGEAEGRPLPNLWERLVAKSLTFTRFHLGHADFGSEKWRRSLDEVIGGIVGGQLKVHIDGVFPFEEAGEMLDRLSSRQVSGKLILAVNPE
jgi:NADPH2:quinone reductase